jgi:hypothetical protein
MNTDKSPRGAVYKDDWKYLLAGWSILTVVLFTLFKLLYSTPESGDFLTFLGICISSLFGILSFYEFYIYRTRD